MAGKGPGHMPLAVATPVTAYNRAEAVEVACPPNAFEGMEFSFQTPAGYTHTMFHPAGARPGQVLTVVVTPPGVAAGEELVVSTATGDVAITVPPGAGAGHVIVVDMGDFNEGGGDGGAKCCGCFGNLHPDLPRRVIGGCASAVCILLVVGLAFSAVSAARGERRSTRAAACACTLAPGPRWHPVHQRATEAPQRKGAVTQRLINTVPPCRPAQTRLTTGRTGTPASATAPPPTARAAAAPPAAAPAAPPPTPPRPPRQSRG